MLPLQAGHIKHPQINPCYILSDKQGNNFYKDTGSEERLHKLVPRLLPSQLIISLISQEYLTRQETAPLDLPPLALSPKCNWLHCKMNFNQIYTVEPPPQLQLIRLMI